LVCGIFRGIFWMVNQRTRRPNTDISDRILLQ
jgi:hypothetical protein